MIALIDYGAGNLTSVRKAFGALDAELFVPATPDDVDRASAVVVPGVGNFRATAALTDDWREAIVAAIGIGRPLLGICLGMQWLFEGSEEAPDLQGLGLMNGRCELIRADVKVPHVGWNALEEVRGGALLDGVPSGSQVYFTHSYAAPLTGDTAAATEHGVRFASAVERANIFGVQFHPEKSGDVGLRILNNFVSRMRLS